MNIFCISLYPFPCQFAARAAFNSFMVTFFSSKTSFFIAANESGAMVKELLEELSPLGREGRGIVDAVLIRLACHSAVRGNFLMKREEMEALLADLRPFDLSTTCPHGRPVFCVVHRDELAKRFRRK